MASLRSHVRIARPAGAVWEVVPDPGGMAGVVGPSVDAGVPGLEAHLAGKG